MNNVTTASQRLSVVMACDHEYAMPLATTLRSIAEHNQTSRCIDVTVMSSNFSAGMRKKVLRSIADHCIAVRWVPASLDAFSSFSTQPYISKMTYARLLLADCFPDDVNKVLYLDADILVLGDLAELFETDLAGAAIGAVIDIDSPIHAKRLGLDVPCHKPAAGHESDAKYFNAGVLLVDLGHWRRLKISARAIDYLRRNPETAFSDQDALNAVCAGHWKLLDERWNVQDHGNAPFRYPEQYPSILHFIGQWKPWKPVCPSEYARFYDEVRDRTEFARTAVERTTDALQRTLMRSKVGLKTYRSRGLNKLRWVGK